MEDNRLVVAVMCIQANMITGFWGWLREALLLQLLVLLRMEKGPRLLLELKKHDELDI